MRKIYIKYLEQANKTDNQYSHIQIDALNIRQDFYINSIKKDKIVFPFQKQNKKIQ